MGDQATDFLFMIESRWDNLQKVVYMDPHLKDI